MKASIQSIPTFLGVVAISIFLAASSGGRAAAAGEGNTGAPGDNPSTCLTCHNGGPIQVEIQINITDSAGNSITEYTPNHMYNAEVLVNETAGTPLGYGFQMVALANVNNSGLVGWESPASNVQITSANNRSYAEHNDVTTNNSFQMKWKAPAAGTGDITFYAAGNGVNKNSATSGDGAALTSLLLAEKNGPPIAVELINMLMPKVFPNPVKDLLNVKNFKGSVEIFDAKGKLVYANAPDTDVQSIDFSSLPNGVYFIHMHPKNGETIRKKVVKL